MLCKYTESRASRKARMRNSVYTCTLLCCLLCYLLIPESAPILALHFPVFCLLFHLITLFSEIILLHISLIFNHLHNWLKKVENKSRLCRVFSPYFELSASDSRRHRSFPPFRRCGLLGFDWEIHAAWRVLQFMQATRRHWLLHLRGCCSL